MLIILLLLVFHLTLSFSYRNVRHSVKGKDALLLNKLPEKDKYGIISTLLSKKSDVSEINIFKNIVMKFNLNESQNQLFYDLCLTLLACLVGIVTTAIVIMSRNAISFIDRIRFNRPILTPVIGSLVVSLLYSLDNNMGINPFSSNFLRKELKIDPNNSNTDLTLSLSWWRQIYRLVAVIFGIGSGCSLG